MQAKARKAKILMEFDYTKAQELANRHNLSKKTIEVWKSRGKIPKMYFRQNTFEETILMDYLKNPKLNTKAIFEKSGISYHKFVAANRNDHNHIHLSKENIQILLDEIQKIKTSISLLTDSYRAIVAFEIEEKLLIEECLIDNPIIILEVLECSAIDLIYRRYMKRRAKKPAKKFESWECIEYLRKLEKLNSEL